MSCSCKVEEKPQASTDRLNIEAIIERNAKLITDGAQARHLRFPRLREIYAGVELISTFSHLNVNLPIDEIYGNYVLQQVAERVGLKTEQVRNAAYDNILPGHDAPKGYRVQYVIVNPPVLDPERVIHLQDALNYDPNAVIRDGQNRIKSAPEQKIEEFRARYDEIDGIYRKHSGSGRVAERIVDLRRDFLALAGVRAIPEQPFSQSLTCPLADVLEFLYHEGFPFWEMPVPAHRDRYVEYTFLIEGVDARGSRQPARFEDDQFVFRYDEKSEKRIPSEKIFAALCDFEVVPTMPLVILATATAPQMPHLGGRVWKSYAPVHVDAQSEWLGINERSDTLILSTEGHKPLVTYRQNQEFTGFPAVYLTYGREIIQKALREGLQLRVEFKRIVY